MRRWLTISEIAEAALPGLPASHRGVDKRAKAEGWMHRPGLSRPRKGRGGGTEYSIEVLPEEARRALVERDGSIEIEPEVMAAVELREDDPLTGEEKDRRDARLHILTLFDGFRRAKDLAVRDARVLFADLWNAGSVLAPEWVRNIVKTVSWRTIETWRATLRDHGPDALGIDRRGRPSIIGTAADGAAEMATIAAIAKNEFLAGDHLADYLRDKFEVDVSVRTVQRTRRVLETRHRNVLMKLRDPDGYRSKIKAAATNSTFSAGLNDLWQIDASPADVMLVGKRRHSIYLAIDIWSRRVMVLVSESARAQAVAMLMRKCILAWGVPKRVMTDQGSDFTAKATARLMEQLRIEHDICDAFDPAKKGNVERAIGTFQRDLAVCPGFIGHNVGMRKKIESRKAFSRRLGMPEAELFDVDLSLVEFQGWCDTWATEIYGTSQHSALRGTTRTPALRAASWTGDIPKLTNPAALDVLISPLSDREGVRRVTKKGIQIDREYYMTAAAFAGEDVLVRMDPMDLGRVLLFAIDGETYLGEAICPPLAGIDPVEMAVRVKAAQKDREKAITDEVRRSMRAIGPRDFMDAMQSQARKKVATLAYLERPAAPYTTPALDAAQEAIDAARPEAPAYTPEQKAQTSAAIVPMPATRRSTPEERFRRALRLEEQIEGGHPVEADDEAWLRGYRMSAEYKGWMKVFEQRGPAMFAG